jgi:KDO2-lipid IV(A) lauroyltransferase
LSPFFGRQTLTTTLVSRLAQKTQCGVVQLACLRRADGDGFDIHFDMLPDEIRSPDLQVSVDCMNRAVEALIRRDPVQYQWAYKRFKDAPQFNEIYRMNEADAKVALAKMAEEQARANSIT